MMQTSVLAVDSASLAVRTYAPATPPLANLVLGAAMGVRQAYYEPFARWLAEQGYRVTTFDYRGVGDSRGAAWRGSLRGFQADLRDWVRTRISKVTQPRSYEFVEELPRIPSGKLAKHELRKIYGNPVAMV